MKKTHLVLAAFLFFSAATGQTLERPFFNGYMGVNGDVNLVPEFSLQGYFSGQLDFSGLVFIRGEFYLQTVNLLDNGLFEEPVTENAKFKIQELSATYRHSGFNITQFFSAFLGEYESIGSDVFLQRQFGMAPITSRITTSWHGLNGASVYPFYGLGLSYVLHFQKPFALGAYVYGNKNSLQSTNTILADLRFACTFSNFTFDVAGGFSFPMQTTTDSGERVILLVKEVDIHGGFNMLIGNRNQTSLFIQAGVGDLNINPSSSSVFDFNDFYFLFEPRFMREYVEFDISAFDIPNDSIYDMTYLDSLYTSGSSSDEIAVMGANLCVVTEKLFIRETPLTLGGHLTLAFINPQIIRSFW